MYHDMTIYRYIVASLAHTHACRYTIHACMQAPHTHTHTHTNTHTHIHTHTYTPTHPHTHTHTLSLSHRNYFLMVVATTKRK